MNVINLRNFSLYPGPRFSRLGPDSGEEFRDQVLIPALRLGEPIAVCLDGVIGAPGSSFLDEAFAGLIRCGIDPEIVRSIEILATEDPALKEETIGYIEDAIDVLNNN